MDRDDVMTGDHFDKRWRSSTSGTRLVVMVIVGVVVGVGVGVSSSWTYAPTAGWVAGAATFTAWVWLAITRMDAEQTASHATREDPSRGSTDLLVLSASVVSLGAVGLVLVEASSAKGATAGILAGSAICSVVMSWLLIHTVFTLRYALLYYTGPDGGIDFNQDEPPRYTDFAYLAFTLGMTYQVSDTDLQDHRMRITALRHCLLAYLFGAVILATIINLVAGLSSGGG